MDKYPSETTTPTK